MQVILPLDKMPILSYLADSEMDLAAGDLVLVPFRSKQLVGMVYSNDKIPDHIDPKKLKKIISKLDLPSIPPKLIEYITQVASYNMSPLGSVMKMVIPIDPMEKYKIKQSGELKINLLELSDSQKKAAEHIIEKLDQGYSTSLLDGVTGSGKTEVYFEAIAHILEKTDGQILILLPEIVLTSQLIKRFEARFGFAPSQFHSGISDGSRRQIWHQVIKGEARLIIGARSALFLPFKKLAIIIVDEEHESSYKQEDKVNYQARDMAVLKAHIEKIPIVLSSATPSLETVYNYIQGKYSKIILESRFGNASMPSVIIADMRSVKKDKNQYISEVLRNKLEENLANNKQAMLFLNRRGYAPLTLCGSCGFKQHCPDCTSWLVEHRSKNHLECHHCGYYRPIQRICSECGVEDNFIACGPGVERIEEEVKLLFPDARVITMTRDNVNSVKKSRELVESILNKEVDIIVGTQVIAKGHHFPELSLVGVIDADVGLAGGDLRSAEKTYQLLHQVGGRAGREKDKGEVVIQTYYPDNLIIQSLSNNDRKSFVEHELASRSAADMPPYSRLAAIIISGNNEENTRIFAREFVRLADYNSKLLILGPVPAILSRLKRQFRYRILIKAPKNFNIQQYLNNWLLKNKVPSTINVKIDIDPYYFN
ncbi:Primosomal protein N' [Candidatus Arcanobacter lacustris]|uniref:Replication restart protein PriA n=1 Tax=Candidatus Arcanibacter lacustris TaxID=1607817 RepID=A0A0F5MPQ8_9RICK|nr:Primosomal protein N' [Candidatus Arcanobacter lacustris]